MSSGDSLEDVVDKIRQDVNRIDENVNGLFNRIPRLFERIEDLEEKIADVELERVADGGDKPYSKLSREEKVQRIRLTLVEQAQQSPREKAMMEFGDIKWLFDAKPSTGHIYDLMKHAGSKQGFDYQTFEDRNHRVVVDLDELNDETLVHAANSRSGIEGD